MVIPVGKIVIGTSDQKSIINVLMKKIPFKKKNIGAKY